VESQEKTIRFLRERVLELGAVNLAWRAAWRSFPGLIAGMDKLRDWLKTMQAAERMSEEVR
jgi:hypothetical protein